MTLLLPGVPLFKKSCCGCSLRRGSLIIISVELTLAIAKLTATYIGMTMLYDLKPETPAPSQSSSHSGNNTTTSYDPIVLLYTLRTSITIAVIVMWLLIISMFGPFVFGVYKRKPVLMLPYLLFTAVSLALNCLFGLFSTIIMMPLIDLQGFLINSSHLTLTILGTSFFFIYYSYYRQLEEKGNTVEQHEDTADQPKNFNTHI